MRPFWSPETFRIHEVDDRDSPALGLALSYYAPEAHDTIQDALRSAIEEGKPWDLELPLITAKGRRIWVRTQCACVVEAGKVVRLRGAFHDIAERKPAEQLLLESKNFSISIIDSLTTHIAVLDRTGVIVTLNQAWRQFALDNGAGDSPDSVGVGVNHLACFAIALADPHREKNQATEAGIRAVLSGELAEFHSESPCHSSSGDQRFLLSVAPMTGAAGGAVVSHTDVTDRKLAELALLDSETRYRELFDVNPQPMWGYDIETLAFLAVNTAALTQYGYSRAEFLAMTVDDIRPAAEIPHFHEHLAALEVSQSTRKRWLHRRTDEIRTPMKAVMGILYMLLQGDLDDKQRDFASEARWAARNLLRLINDILDFSKIDAGKLVMDDQPFEVAAVVAQAIEAVEFDFRAKGLRLEYTVEPGAPALLLGDAQRIQQALVNLLGNALKFTEHGRVSLSVGCAFQPFSQVDPSASRRFQGTGLGLSLQFQRALYAAGRLRRAGPWRSPLQGWPRLPQPFGAARCWCWTTTRSIAWRRSKCCACSAPSQHRCRTALAWSTTSARMTTSMAS
jgi:PAS domain S-box-containing protein